MTGPAALVDKIFDGQWASDPKSLPGRVAELSRPLVFTNGCFDILHRGHVTYLTQAAELGASLLVGVNDDASVRDQDKGGNRPINCLEDRMAVLAALQAVSLLVPFSDPTPLSLIRVVEPDVLVKGGDWPVSDIVGASEVQARGGSVHSIPFIVERSTTSLIERIRDNG